MFTDLTRNIPKDARICIYGSAKAGVFFKRYVQASRKDVEIVCFLNSFESGMVDGLKVVKLSDIESIQGEYDLIVITAESLHTVVSILELYNIHNYIDVNASPLLFWANFLEKEGKFSKKISDEYKKQNQEKFEKAKNIFKEPGDQKLYEIVIESRCNQEGYDSLLEYSLANIPKTNTQYLEFINKPEIKTIIDGGTYNGATAVKFLYHFENVEKIYAFEPLYDLFKEESFVDFIANSDKIEICNYAISDRKAELKFSEDDQASSLIIEDSLSQEVRYHMVQAISIDEFAEENNLDRLDFIKFDIEGAELAGLIGAQKSLHKFRPQLAICLYHQNKDYFEIPLYLESILENYTFRFDHQFFSYWDSILYAIPNELYQQ